MAKVCIHLGDKVVVADGATGLRAHAAHQLIDLIVAKPDLERVKRETELLSTDDAVAVDVEDRESLLQVEVVDVEVRRYLVENFVEAHLPKLLGFKSPAEGMEIDTPKTERICDAAQNPLVLDSQWQVQSVHKCLELTD